MTRCTVARGQRPRATVHRVIHSTEGVSFGCCTERYEIVVLLPNSKLTKGNNKRNADVRRVCYGGSGSLNSNNFVVCGQKYRVWVLVFLDRMSGTL